MSELQRVHITILFILLCQHNLHCFHLNSTFQLVAVHLVDSHYCSDPGKFISVLLTSLSTMLQIELPHVNVLSKMDLIQQYGKLREYPFPSVFAIRFWHKKY